MASACAYFGGGPSSYALGNNSDNLLGQEWVTPGGRDHSHRFAEFRVRLVLLRRPRPKPARHHARRAGLARRAGHLHQVRHQAGALAGTAHAGTARAAARLSPAGSREHARLHHRRAQLGRVGGVLLRRSTITRSATSSTASSIWPAPTWRPALWLTYIDPTKTLNDVETAAKDPEIQKITEEARISFQLILAANSVEGIELQDKILDGILAQTGCYKVKRFCEPDMAEFTNMYMQRLGHKHCNFIWVGGYMGSWMQAGHAGFRQEIRARWPSTASTATRRATSWWNAAATP